MSYLLLGIAATILGSIGLVASDILSFRGGRLVSKPVASAGFVLAAAGSGAIASAPGRLLVIGLLLGFVGDVLLLFEGPRAFVLGLASFLAGHLAYVAAFLARGAAPEATAVAALFLSAPAYGIGCWLWPHVGGRLRVPVLAYVVVISSMVALAGGTAWRRPGAAILAGAVAFYLSDIAVARETFVVRSRFNRALGLPLYYGGQLLLAISVR